ncbi:MULTISPECIES: MBL fold metallo-hydrolase [unclassified Porphyromonas]|uniref:MBL fold metallo-hydrolase n=1 Tax=Porphyromonas sp. oral taxon 275 TaxID=712435 RepID=UPI001BAAED40|nr:MBL fold metallo-hydrolase [Porphyromonas sp. oral taxon 275]QUB42259.1 MBL fold metallo-hydrolase [Porphyromonas sp. oral taxon 275]
MLKIKQFTFGPVQENTYVLYDEASREAAIVDPGCMRHSEEDQLRDFIEEQGLEPKLLLCTHQHFDHVWGAAYVLRTWPGLLAYANRIDFEKLPLPSDQLKGYGIPLPLEDVPESRYTLVEQDDTIQLGGETLRVLFVPGHAPGHIAFYAADSGILLSGDTLLLGTIGRTDFWYGDYDQLLAAIKAQYMPLPDETIVFSGHGPETTIGHERRHNSFLR